MKKTLAIFSPNEITYSETFIQAHKKLPYNIRYYYGGKLPVKAEFNPNLIDFSLRERIEKKITQHGFNLREYALMNSLKKENVDCVLAEYGPTACATLKVVSFLKIPLVVHFHGFDASHKETIKTYRDQYLQVFDYASAIIAVSKKMKTDLICLGCDEKKITISSCGPDSLYFKNNPGYNNQSFLTIGRFVEKKSPFATILAFKKVTEKYPDAKLFMVGDGELHSSCEVLARVLRIENNIEFKGIQNKEYIKILFEESIAFIQHSVVAESGDSEGTPVAVLEAQAAALPVIGTFHAGIPDIVINNETGLLVEENDIAGTATNMIRILSENGLAKKLGEKGRERVFKNFTLEMHLKSLEKIIDKAIVS